MATASSSKDQLFAEQHTGDPHKEYPVRRHKINKVSPLTTMQLWKPFQSRAEFEFAEVAIRVSLTKKQVDTLIQLMKRCINGEDKFEIHNYDHLYEIWNAGAVY